MAGVTLVEMVIATALVSLVISGLLILSTSTGRSLAEMVNYVDLDHYNRVALDKMTREIRQVRALTSFSPTLLVFEDHDGTPIKYEYSAITRTLRRQRGEGADEVLLEQCDALKFAMYQRSPSPNTYDLIPASSPAICKVITVTWNCSRTLFGLKANTEQGQTAKIVIRNKQS